MEQESNPRFSHITVGKTNIDGLPPEEDEEVIPIGVVDIAPESQSEAAVAIADDTGFIGNTVKSEERGGKEGDAGLSLEQSDDEEDFGGPMPLVQKLVIIGCAIGVVVVIVFLIWFRTAQ